MARRLAYAVLVRDDQEVTGFTLVPAGTPDSDPRTKGITNPVAWEAPEDGAEPAVEPVKAPAKKAAAKKAAAKKAAASDGAADDEKPAGAAPSGDAAAERPADDADAAAWAVYASALGQEVPEGAEKDDIVAQLEAAGLLEQ